MSRSRMATQAVGRVRTVSTVHPRSHFTVAAQAIVPCNARVEGCNADRLWEAAQGEGPAVLPAVDPFHHPVSEKAVRGMAIITGRYRLMAPVIPAFKNFAHYVAIHAGGGIVRQVGMTLRIMKSESAEPRKTARESSQKDHQP